MASNPNRQPLSAPDTRDWWELLKMLACSSGNKPSPEQPGVRTVCRRYSCAKVTVMGETRYELWKLNKSRDWYLRVVGDLVSFADVQELAQKDLRESV